jgi:Na+/proline symporter
MLVLLIYLFWRLSTKKVTKEHWFGKGRKIGIVPSKVHVKEMGDEPRV